MLTNNYVSLREWFYPIGNMPAVNLLRHATSTEAEKNIELLLLGCGDPRNILFSLFCQDGQREFANPMRFVSLKKETSNRYHAQFHLL
jgi:hypothetical protein